MKALKRTERIVISVILAAVAILMASEFLSDRVQAMSFFQIMTEVFTALLAILGLVLLWTKASFLDAELADADSQHPTAPRDSGYLKKENQKLLEGIADTVDKQFDLWKLSDAEKEVALLLLQDMDFKDIAHARNVRESTVRQQALSVYGKSGLEGRAELAAFFLNGTIVGSTKKAHR